MNNIEQLKQIIENAVWPTSHVDIASGEFFTYDHNNFKYRLVNSDGAISEDCYTVGFLRSLSDIKTIVEQAEEIKRLVNSQFSDVLIDGLTVVEYEQKVKKLAVNDFYNTLKLATHTTMKMDELKQCYVENLK